MRPPPSATPLMQMMTRQLRLVGVELDGEVMGVARRWFGLAESRGEDGSGLELLVEDALHYVRRRSNHILDTQKDDGQSEAPPFPHFKQTGMISVDILVGGVKL